MIEVTQEFCESLARQIFKVRVATITQVEAVRRALDKWDGITRIKEVTTDTKKIYEKILTKDV